MALIGRDILTRNTLKRKTITVPEWDGDIIIRELTGKEAGPVSQGALEIADARRKGEAIDGDKAVRWQALTVCYGWINEDGSNVLSPTDIDDLLKSQPNAVIANIAKEIRVLSGLQTADEESKTVEEAQKNLTETQSDASGSA